MIRSFLPWLAAAALIFAVIAVARMQPVREPAPPPQAPPEATFAQTIAAVGLVEPRSENIAISIPVPGLVTSVSVSAGQLVQAGQVLFSIDDRDLRAELEVRRSALKVAQAQLQKLERSPRTEDIPPAEAQVREAQAALDDAKVQQQLIDGVKDRRAIREEDRLRRGLATKAAAARLARAKTELDLLKAGTWKPDLEVARAQVVQAQAQLEKVQTDLDRLTIRAPMAATVLKVDVRPGEYAQAGPLERPLMVLGDLSQWHIRADVDEHQAWQVRAGARAEATERGNASRRVPLEFVRFEPYVVPKRSLTGAGTERVDTRVLQVIYRIAAQEPGLYVGQQMDVFIQGAQASAQK
jgi:multidrug efflux pump subunit AcrA (membrane-fusion protein)